jgi:catechol 2,3-dioxygenase-like lactoylglutathione lyase family enzyme
VAALSLNHVSVCAADIEESVAFYADLFGAEPIATPNFGFPVRWLRVGDRQLHLFERPGDAPRYAHLALTVDDLDTLYRAARARRCLDSETFGHHLYELPGDCVQLYLRDPAGNLVEADALGVDRLSAETRADLQRLADAQPQGPENERATLFLEGAVR